MIIIVKRLKMTHAQPTQSRHILRQTHNWCLVTQFKTHFLIFLKNCVMQD